MPLSGITYNLCTICAGINTIVFGVVSAGFAEEEEKKGEKTKNSQERLSELHLEQY